MPPGISERNPVDFEGAAGLTSKHIYLAENPLKGLISNPAKDSRDPLKPTLHLRMARSGGEAEETIYGGHLAENVDAGHEPHLLAPEAYDGCAGLTSKEISSRNVDLAIHQSNLAVGKKHITLEHEAGRGSPEP